jgi:hypothetical protein
MSSIVRLDSVKSVYGGHIYSVQATNDLQNGQVGVVGNLLSGEREVRALNQPSAVATDKAVLVAAPEIIYDESSMAKQNLKNFSIPANTATRAYELQEDDVFSVSDDAITALASEPVVGNSVVLANASNKLAEATDVTGHRFVGHIEAIETIGTSTVTGAPGLIAGGVSNLVVIRVLAN